MKGGNMKNTLVGAVLGYALGAILCSLSSWASIDILPVPDYITKEISLEPNDVVRLSVCRDKLEKAMREMEPFFAPLVATSAGYPDALHDIDVKKLEAAMRLWADVKRDCWRPDR